MENDQLSNEVFSLKAGKRELVDIAETLKKDLIKTEGKLNQANSEIIELR